MQLSACLSVPRFSVCLLPLLVLGRAVTMHQGYIVGNMATLIARFNASATKYAEKMEQVSTTSPTLATLLLHNTSTDFGLSTGQKGFQGIVEESVLVLRVLPAAQERLR